MPFNEAELDRIKTRAADEGEEEPETTKEADAMTEWAEYAIDQLPKHCDDLGMMQDALARVWHDQKAKHEATLARIAKYAAERERKKLDGGYLMEAVNQLTGNMRAVNKEIERITGIKSVPLGPFASETIDTHSPREEATYHAPVVVKDEKGRVVRIYSKKRKE